MSDFKVSFSGIPDKAPLTETANTHPKTLIHEVTMDVSEITTAPLERLKKIQDGMGNEALIAAEQQQIIDLQDTLSAFGKALDLVEILLDDIIPRYGENLTPLQMNERVDILQRIFDRDLKIVAQYLQTFQDHMARFTLLIVSRYGLGFKVPYNTNFGPDVMRLSDTDFTHGVFQVGAINWVREDELSLDTVSSPADRGGFRAQSSLSTEYADQFVRDMKVILKIFLPLAKRFGAFDNRIIIALEALKTPTEE